MPRSTKCYFAILASKFLAECKYEMIGKVVLNKNGHFLCIGRLPAAAHSYRCLPMGNMPIWVHGRSCKIRANMPPDRAIQSICQSSYSGTGQFLLIPYPEIWSNSSLVSPSDLASLLSYWSVSFFSNSLLRWYESVVIFP